MEDRIRSAARLRSHFFLKCWGLTVFPAPKEREGPELPSGRSTQDLGGERTTVPVPLSSLVTSTLLLFDVVDRATPEAAGRSASPPSTGRALSPGALGTRTTAA